MTSWIWVAVGYLLTVAVWVVYAVWSGPKAGRGGQ